MAQQSPFRCQSCGAEFATQEQLQEHGRQEHSMAGVKTGSFRCPACGTEFSTVEQLQQHAQQAHQRT